MRFLVAEDHELVSATLIELLKATFHQSAVQWVTTSSELLKAFRDTSWDMLLLDIELADTASLDLIPRLKKMRPNCKILVYTGHPEKEFGMQAVKAGADGFIHKGSPAAEFVCAIKAVIKGQKFVPQRVALGFVEAFQRCNGTEKDVSLSAREFQVMCSIAAGKYNSEIAAELGLSQKTVSTYRSRILVKLGLRSNADLIKHALRMGYVK